MSSYLNSLSNPATEFYTPEQLNVLASEVQAIAFAAREQVNADLAAGKPGLETAIVQISAFADQLQERANKYRAAALRRPQ